MKSKDLRFGRLSVAMNWRPILAASLFYAARVGFQGAKSRPYCVVGFDFGNAKDLSLRLVLSPTFSPNIEAVILNKVKDLRLPLRAKAPSRRS